VAKIPQVAQSESVRLKTNNKIFASLPAPAVIMEGMDPLDVDPFNFLLAGAFDDRRVSFSATGIIMVLMLIMTDSDNIYCFIYRSIADPTVIGTGLIRVHQYFGTILGDNLKG